MFSLLDFRVYVRPPCLRSQRSQRLFTKIAFGEKQTAKGGDLENHYNSPCSTRKWLARKIAENVVQTQDAFCTWLSSLAKNDG
jgi:hypothetical protein